MNTSFKDSNEAPLGGDDAAIKAAIEEEAGLWLIKIDERQLSQDETRELLVWVRRSDYHRNYLVRLAGQWDSMAALSKLSALFPLVEYQAEKGRGSTGHWWSTGSGVFGISWQPVAALCLVIAVIVGWQSTLFLGASAPKNYITDVGELGRHTLSDGSIISLNTNTQVQVDYSGSHRKITLLQGEANFDVAKNKDKPFMVHAGSGVVRAVGTAFNVRFAGRDTVAVIVTEGRVNVMSQGVALTAGFKGQVGDQHVILDAGQRVLYSEVSEKNDAMSIDVVPIDPDVLERKLAWQQGSLVFKGETLEKAIAEISRYTTKQLIIADASLSLLEVGGRYRTDNIDSLLMSLADVMDIEIQYLSNNKIQFIEKNKNKLKKQ